MQVTKPHLFRTGSAHFSLQVSTLSLQCESSYRQRISDCVWLCFKKTLIYKNGQGTWIGQWGIIWQPFKKKDFFSSLYFLYFLYFPLKIKTLKIYFDNNQFPTFYIWFSYWKKKSNCTLRDSYWKVCLPLLLIIPWTYIPFISLFVFLSDETKFHRLKHLNSKQSTHSIKKYYYYYYYYV